MWWSAISSSMAILRDWVITGLLVRTSMPSRTDSRQLIVIRPPSISTPHSRQALHDAAAHNAFSAEYIANLLEFRSAVREPSPLHLSRNQDLLELELPEPDLGVYDSRLSTNPPPSGGWGGRWLVVSAAFQ